MEVGTPEFDNVLVDVLARHLDQCAGIDELALDAVGVHGMALIPCTRATLVEKHRYARGSGDRASILRTEYAEHREERRVTRAAVGARREESREDREQITSIDRIEAMTHIDTDGVEWSGWRTRTDRARGGGGGGDVLDRTQATPLIRERADTRVDGMDAEHRAAHEIRTLRTRRVRRG